MPERMEIASPPRSEIEPLRFVERERDRFAGAPQLAQDEMILRGQARARVGEKNEPVGFLHGALGLLAHLRLDAGGILDETAGVDHDVGNRTHSTEAVLAVAGEPGDIRDDGVAGAGQNIEKRRLADVGPAHEGDDGQHPTPRLLVLLRFNGRRRGRFRRRGCRWCGSRRGLFRNLVRPPPSHCRSGSCETR